MVLPLLAGSALGQALHGRSAPFVVVGGVLAWGLWAVVLVATLVPRTTSLTVYRVIAPGALVAALWATAAGVGPLAAGVAIAGSASALGVAFLPATGDVFVDGSSYGPERRLALRVPGALLLGPLELSWIVAFGGAVTGPLLLGAGQWVIGGALIVLGWPVARAAALRLHVLARRWIVLVPAGLVVHDPLALADAGLFARRSIVAIRPAPADSAGVDLTVGALGLAVEVVFDEPQELSVPRGRKQPPETVTAASLLITATRPAHLLEAARAHRLPAIAAPPEPG